VRVRASAAQAERLLAWAQAWPERTWAVEGAGGLGHLLAQELVAAGELVLDVQPKLAARVRLLAAGAVNKNDPNDARSAAIAALRSPSCVPVRPDDHAAVLKIWAKRHRDLSRGRNQVACRLHAALCDLVPGGPAREIYADQADQLLREVEPCGAVQQARAELAAELVAGLRRVDALLRETKKKLAVAVRASWPHPQDRRPRGTGEGTGGGIRGTHPGNDPARPCRSGDRGHPDHLRWAVGRIREHPAYAQLQERVHEIDQLKAQF
jgi:transposase